MQGLCRPAFTRFTSFSQGPYQTALRELHVFLPMRMAMLGLPPFGDLQGAAAHKATPSRVDNVQQVVKVTGSVYLELKPTRTRMAPTLSLAVREGLIPGKQMPAAFAFAPSRYNRRVRLGIIVGAEGCTGRDYSERFRQLGQAMDRDKKYWPSNVANLVHAVAAQANGPPDFSRLHGMVRVAREVRCWVEFTRREYCAYQPKANHPLLGYVGQAAQAGGEYDPPEGFSVVAHYLQQRQGAVEKAMGHWRSLLSCWNASPSPSGHSVELDFSFPAAPVQDRSLGMTGVLSLHGVAPP